MKPEITKVLLLLFCSSTYLSQLFAQDITDNKKDDAFLFQASYVGDNMNNFSGGIKKGFDYLGMANFIIGFDSEKAGLWKGGQFYINATNTHGASPSKQLIGDIQVASNIEAGNHTFIQELWYKQTFSKVELALGLQNLNAQFANTEHGGLYLNSSFGVHSTISGNIPAPVYPLTSLGFSAKWTATEKITWLTAIFNGCRNDFDHNPYNLNWRFDSEDGFLGITELQYSVNLKNMPGTYKAGIYSHHHFFEKNNISGDPDSLCSNNYGLYAVADQMLWRKSTNKEGLGMFLQFSISPVKYNDNYFYTGAGINYYGLFDKEGNDVLGLAVAHAGLKSNTGSETTLELTYKTRVTKNISLQPDIQYIFNPAGAGTKLKNSIEGTIRLGITF